jgi:hypothetical protein
MQAMTFFLSLDRDALLKTQAGWQFILFNGSAEKQAPLEIQGGRSRGSP